MVRSTSAGAKLCPKAYGEPQTGQRHELPIRRTCVRELSQCWVGHATCVFSCFLVSCFWRQPKNKRAARKLSLNPPSWPFYPILWLASSHASCRPPTSHFSASGAAAGAKYRPPTRPLVQLQHTTRERSPPATPRSPVTALTPHVHVPLPRHTSSAGRTTGPGAGNECVDRLE